MYPGDLSQFADNRVGADTVCESLGRGLSALILKIVSPSLWVMSLNVLYRLSDNGVTPVRSKDFDQGIGRTPSEGLPPEWQRRYSFFSITRCIHKGKALNS